MGAEPRELGARPGDRGGREAVRFGFEVAALRRIISVTRADHQASRRVMEKCGLVLQAEILFRGVTCAWYALDRESWSQHVE